ncbi:MAG: 3-dehydroquinate synthase [Clostridiales bacterium]|nr:3-dehydroquinate synthase [Clostridiales bacterium]
METINLKYSSGDYNIYVGEGILAEALEIFFENRDYDRVFVVSDSNVFKFYGELLRENLVKLNRAPAGEYVFLAGEPSKRLSTVSEMYDAFAKAHLTRHSLVIALGGGVCGDMAGFAAATYLRGIDVVQMPTTLLAQIDSSIGGKTGVDLEVGKNLVGAFKQPVAVIADSSFLSTLPKRYIDDGMGEAVKYGCIYDEELFNGITSKQIDRAEMIYRCMKIKAEVVEIDECETGLRMILNYGHTLGHAVEKLGNFERFSHGESIGIGMLYAAKLGEKLGYQPVYDKIKAALEAWELPTVMDYPVEELVRVVGSDKKRSGDDISFVLLDGIGKSFTQKLPISKVAELIG